MNRFLKALPFLFMLFCATFSMAQQFDTPPVQKMKADKKPEFVGGNPALITFINKQLKYPETAQKALLEGTISVGFRVETDGSITGVKVRTTKYTIRKTDEKTKQTTAVATTNPTDKSLEQEAMRVIKAMPRWSPAEYQKTKVAVDYALPVKFTLQ